MRLSQNQSLRTGPAFKLDLGSHKLDALLGDDSQDPNGWLSDKRPSTKRIGLSR